MSELQTSDSEKLLLQTFLEAAKEWYLQSNRQLGENEELTAFSSKFMSMWFYKKNKDYPKILIPSDRPSTGPFVFIFNKNLNVTNAIPSEFVTLLRLHSKINIELPNGDGKKTVEFSSDAEFTSYLENTWLSFLGEMLPEKNMKFSQFISSSFETCERSETQVDVKRALQEDVERTLAERVLEFCKNRIFSTIIVDFNFTSATVQIPCTVNTELELVLAESGYLHSYGMLLYARRIESVDPCVLRDQILNYAKKQENCAPIDVVPYSDEFFPLEKEKAHRSLRNGLDGLRIDTRKHYVGSTPILDFLRSVEAKSNQNVRLPTGLESLSLEGEDDQAMESHSTSIWMVCDNDTQVAQSTGEISRGANRKLICYVQLLLNDSQFLLLKERKPGWYASITLPHTFSSACVNIARGILNRGDEATIALDPFCGSGTSLFDLKVRDRKITVLGIDREEIVPSAISANIEFFTSSRILKPLFEQFEWTPKDGELKLEKQIEDCLHEVKLDIEAGLKRYWKYTEEDLKINRENAKGGKIEDCLHYVAYANWFSLRHETSATDEDNQHANHFVLGYEEMDKREQSFPKRLLEELKYFQEESLQFVSFLIFSVWRGLSRGQFALRQKPNFVTVIVAEFRNSLIEWGAIYAAQNCEPHEELGSSGQEEVWVEGKSPYSNFVNLHPSRLKVSLQGLNQLTQMETEIEERTINKDRFEVGDFTEAMDPTKINYIHAKRSYKDLDQVCLGSIDVLNTLPQKSIDLIITDPPYGYNANEGSLRSLFHELIPACIKCLNTGGLLMLIVPTSAGNGRTIPYFETHTPLTHEILANSDGRRFVQISDTFPGSRSLARVPLYWRSNSLLERRLLCFKLLE